MNRQKLNAEARGSVTVKWQWASIAGRQIRLLAVIAAVVAVPVATFAQGRGDSHGSDQRGRRSPQPPVESVLDASGDGIIDRGELAGAAEALRSLDTNEDGLLQVSECLPPRPNDGGRRGGGGSGSAGSGRQQPPLPPVMTALDSDQSGAIDADEISAAATALGTLDIDGDGQLGPEEYRPHPPRNGARQQSSGQKKMQW